MEQQFAKKLEVLETKVSGLEMRVALAESDIRTTKEKLDKIEANTTWILRLIIGAIVTALLGMIIIGGSGPM